MNAEKEHRVVPDEISLEGLDSDGPIWVNSEGVRVDEEGEPWSEQDWDNAPGGADDDG